MPRFVLQAALCLERGLERIACRVERGAECIPRDLKHMSVVARDGRMQDGMMAREEGGLRREIAAPATCCLRYR